MTNDYYFHILDIAHGIVMAIFVYLIIRMLVFRKEGALRVRYLAVCLLALAVLQTLDLFEEGSPLQQPMYETLTMMMDGLALVLSVLILGLFYRNRHIYPASVVRTGSGTLILIIGIFIFCAIFRFAEWTYPIYLFVSTAGWVIFCLTIEGIPQSPDEPRKNIVKEDPDNKFRQQLEEVMHRNNMFCNEELTREDVCRAMHTNRTTFAQKLKRAYHKSFSEYLRDMRLEEAKRLLSETDMPIDQLAFTIGLKSASGFYRNFLLTYGMTPTQYRTTHKRELKESMEE